MLRQQVATPDRSVLGTLEKRPLAAATPPPAPVAPTVDLAPLDRPALSALEARKSPTPVDLGPMRDRHRRVGDSDP